MNTILQGGEQSKAAGFDAYEMYMVFGEMGNGEWV